MDEEDRKNKHSIKDFATAGLVFGENIGHSTTELPSFLIKRVTIYN